VPLLVVVVLLLLAATIIMMLTAMITMPLMIMMGREQHRRGVYERANASSGTMS
jgi:hypothetical protein